MALGTTLPAWPALVFTYLEPIALLLGIRSAFSTPSDFIRRQVPVTAATALTPLPDSAYILAYTLGNIYMLLAMIALLCTVATRETRVTKYYLAMLAAADIGHVYASYKGMGGVVFWNYREHNEVMVGNIWVSLFLCVNRIATLAGVFGKLGRTK